jgi:hypothetical protein
LQIRIQRCLEITHRGALQARPKVSNDPKLYNFGRHFNGPLAGWSMGRCSIDTEIGVDA